MGKVFEALNPRLTEFVLQQPMFFVATAPAGDAGHVNVSPKGLAGTLVVIDRSTVAYLDVTGSGVETIAHIRDNGRITLMFCAFEGPPMILRLFGRGEVLLPDDAGFTDLRPRFAPDMKAVRSIIVVNVTEVRTSCGYGVPLMSFVDDRDDQSRWADRQGDDGLVRYWTEKNQASLDDLPGLPRIVAPDAIRSDT
jgi:pyridoxamine 5'-phosphate oxidase-like protein